jgi:magnesium chelatase family protein
MVGRPGAGKTLLAPALPGILPLAPSEALEVTRIYSVGGLLERDRPLITRRPFRAPHHTTSRAGLVVGGHHVVRPGEITLAPRATSTEAGQRAAMSPGARTPVDGWCLRPAHD